jgi:hypothetical protein
VAGSQASHPGVKRGWVIGIVGLVLVVLAGITWRASTTADSTAIDPPVTSDARVSGRADVHPHTRAQQVEDALSSLSQAWAARDRTRFLAAAASAPEAQAWARRTYAALEHLDVGAVRLRLPAERGAGVSVPPHPGQAFTADVLVRWKFHGYVTTSSTVRLSFAHSGDAVSVLGLADGSGSMVSAGSPMPLWLAGKLVGRSGARCVGVDVAADTSGCGGLTRVAEADLSAALPARLHAKHWLVVVPRTAAIAAALLGRPDAGLAGVAAVTSTVDASASAHAPALVILNPAVMVTLERDAAQLVVSHEAVHAATGAAGVHMPLWIAEGFADYVALRAGRVSVPQAASRLLTRVRNTGPPVRLPPDAAFSAGRSDVGQAYESAWLVFRLIAERYDAATVVAFYQAVLRGVPVNTALARHVGLTRAQLTSAWRRRLLALAD